MNTDEKICRECGWVGDIDECVKGKEWSNHAGGGYIAVPHCPNCGSDYIEPLALRRLVSRQFDTKPF